MEDFKVKEPDEITIIKITRNGNEVTTDVEHVEGYEPVDPQAMIGALAGAISKLQILDKLCVLEAK